MNVISLRDYADQRNITYEAVRQQVARYKVELEGHVIKDGRQRFLDEEAVAILDGKRNKSPVTIIQQNKDEEIEVLRQQKEAFLLKIAAQADEIAELAKWKAEQAVLIAAAEQNKVALLTAQTEAQKASQEASEAIQRAITLEQEKNAIRAEYEAYKALPWWKKIKK